MRRALKSAMFHYLKTLCCCLILAAFLAPTAHAQSLIQEIPVNPGDVGLPANDLDYFVDSPGAIQVDLVFTDNKTLEWPAGTHEFFLCCQANQFYVGTLLDAVGNPMPGTVFEGTMPSTGDPAEFASVELSERTVFSGMRFFGGFKSLIFVLSWVDGNRPTVGESDGEPEPEPVTIGGTVTGLIGSGLVLQNNGGDDLPIDSDVEFTFDTPLTPGTSYNVTVKTQPSNPAQACIVANGSGTVPNQPVTKVAVTCAANTAFLPAVYLLLSGDEPSANVVQVFVTTAAYQGNLGGLDGADAECQEIANFYELTGTWKAWLSDDTTNAIDRISDGQYQLLNGTVIANDKADLTDGSLEAPINLSPEGVTILGFAWTGTQLDGNFSGTNCNNWTSNSSVAGCPVGDPSCGTVGSTSARIVEWTELTAAPFQCSAQYSLYCFGGGE